MEAIMGPGKYFTQKGMVTCLISANATAFDSRLYPQRREPTGHRTQRTTAISEHRLTD